MFVVVLIELSFLPVCAVLVCLWAADLWGGGRRGEWEGEGGEGGRGVDGVRFGRGGGGVSLLL